MRFLEYQDNNFVKDDYNFNQYHNKMNFRALNNIGRFCCSTILYSLSKTHGEFMRSNYERYIIERNAVDIETDLYQTISRSK